MSNIPLKEIDGNVSVSRDAHVGGKADVEGNLRVKHNLRVDGWLDAPHIKGPCKGLFLTLEALCSAYPEPDAGSWALVGSTLPAALYVADGGVWTDTGDTAGGALSTENTFLTEEVSRLTEAVAGMQLQTTEHDSTLSSLQSMCIGTIDISDLDNPLGLTSVQEWIGAWVRQGSYTFVVTDRNLRGRCVGHMTLYADPYTNVNLNAPKLIHQCFVTCYAVTDEGSLSNSFAFHPRILFRMRAVALGLTDPYTGDVIPQMGWSKWHDLGETTERRCLEQASATAQQMVSEATETLGADIANGDDTLRNLLKGIGSGASAFEYPFLRLPVVTSVTALRTLLDNFCTTKDALEERDRNEIYKRMSSALMPYVGTLRGVYNTSRHYSVEQYMITWRQRYLQVLTGPFTVGADGTLTYTSEETCVLQRLIVVSSSDGSVSFGAWENLSLTSSLRQVLEGVRYAGNFYSLDEVQSWLGTDEGYDTSSVLTRFTIGSDAGYVMHRRMGRDVVQELYYGTHHSRRCLTLNDDGTAINEAGAWQSVDADAIAYDAKQRMLRLMSGASQVGQVRLPLADSETDGLMDKASYARLQSFHPSDMLGHAMGVYHTLEEADEATIAFGRYAETQPLQYCQLILDGCMYGVLYLLSVQGRRVVQSRQYQGKTDVRNVTYVGDDRMEVQSIGAWTPSTRLRYTPSTLRLDTLTACDEVSSSLDLPAANYATSGMMTSAQAISLSNVEALMLSLPTHEDVEHLYREIDWANDYIEMVRKLYDGLGGLEAKMHVDEENGVLVVTQNGRTWVCNVEEQVKPLSPIMPPTQTFVLTGGSYTLSLRAPTAGSEVYYTTDGSDPREGGGTPGTGVTIAVDLRVECTEHTVRAACKKSGMWSDVVTRVYYTYRKLPAPTFAIGGNSFDSERTVSISVQHGAQVNYGVYVNGERVMQGVYSGALTVTEDKTVVKAQAGKVGWHSSVEVSTGEIRMDVPVIRFGFANSVTSEADIASLPYTKKQENAAGDYEAENHTGGFTYLWLCIGASQTLGSVTSSGYPVPMEDAVVIGDYKVYRSSSTIEEGVMTFKVS